MQIKIIKHHVVRPSHVIKQKKCQEKYRKKFFHIIKRLKRLKSDTDHVLNIQYSVGASLPMKIIQILLLK